MSATKPAKGIAIADGWIQWGIPLLIVLFFSVLATSPDLRVSKLLPVVVCACVGLLGLPLILGSDRAPRWSWATVLIIAVALRIPFLLRPPELSDDIYRYVWDGHSVASGQNPYSMSPRDAVPSDPELLALRAKVNHPELVTIYPPVAQLVFAAGWALPGESFGMKAVLSAMDLLTCVALLYALRSLGLPAWRSALYAWHPLPILEIAGSGHIDGAGVCFLVLCFALLLSRTGPRSAGHRSAVLAGAAYGASVLTKLFPIALLPIVLLLAGKRRWLPFSLAAVAIGVVTTVPFLPELDNLFGTFTAYARRWEFASFSFRTLRDLTGSGELARKLVVAGFVVSVVFLVAPLVLRRGARAADHAASKVDPSFALRALRASYGIALAFLVFTPTLHAWYALYLVAMLPFAAGPAGLAFSAAVFFGYRVLARFVTSGEWVEPDGIATLIIAVPTLAMLMRVAYTATLRSSSRKRTRA